MRTNYSTATSARPEKTKSSGNGHSGRSSASTKTKRSVIDRDFSDSDEWPTAEAEPTVVVSTSTTSDAQGHETDSSHQGYFAEWISEAEAQAVQARTEASTDQTLGLEGSVTPELPVSQTLGLEGSVTPELPVSQTPGLEGSVTPELPVSSPEAPMISNAPTIEVGTQTSTSPESELTVQEKALRRLAVISGPLPEPDEPVATEASAIEAPLADPASSLLALTDDGSEPVDLEELARSTGGYEALAPEQLAIEEPDTVAFDHQVLAHDPNYSASLEQADLRDSGRARNRDILADKIGTRERTSKVLAFDRPVPAVQAQAVRTVDNPHLLVGDYVAPSYLPEAPDGSPMRKAVVLGLVAVVASAAIGVSVQRNQAAEPAFDVASFVEPSSSDSLVEQEVLNDDVDVPELTTTTAAITTVVEEPNLEARKQMQAASAEAPTTTAAPTTTEQAITSVAPSTTTDGVDGAESDTATSAAADSESSSTTAAESQGSETDTTVDPSTETTVADETATTTDSSPTETTAEQTSTTVAEATTTTAATSTEEAWVDAGNGVSLPAVMLDIRYCESRGDYQAANTASSARGAYQFLTGSWKHYGHAERYGVAFAHLASPAQQDEAALKTWQADGTRPWNASKSCWSKNPVA